MFSSVGRGGVEERAQTLHYWGEDVGAKVGFYTAHTTHSANCTLCTLYTAHFVHCKINKKHCTLQCTMHTTETIKHSEKNGSTSSSVYEFGQCLFSSLFLFSTFAGRKYNLFMNPQSSFSWCPVVYSELAKRGLFEVFRASVGRGWGFREGADIKKLYISTDANLVSQKLAKVTTFPFAIYF